MKEKFYIRIKRRIDQGKNYAGYYSMVGMSFLLCKTFGITSKWVYILMVPVLFLLCWLIGLIHEKLILEDEQKGYYKKNPGFTQLENKIDKIIKHIEDDNTTTQIH